MLGYISLMKNQKLLLTDMRYKAYPDADGNYATVFELRAGVFKDGIYAVKADYYGYHDETSVKITDSSLQFKLTNEQAQKEAKERGLYLLNPDDPNFEYRKLYEPNAVTQEEIELIVRKEKGKRKEKDIVQKTR